ALSPASRPCPGLGPAAPRPARPFRPPAGRRAPDDSEVLPFVVPVAWPAGNTRPSLREATATLGKFPDRRAQLVAQDVVQPVLGVFQLVQDLEKPRLARGREL